MVMSTRQGLGAASSLALEALALKAVAWTLSA